MALPAAAQDDWNPFRDRDNAARARRQAVQPAGPPPLPPMDGRPGSPDEAHRAPGGVTLGWPADPPPAIADATPGFPPPRRAPAVDADVPRGPIARTELEPVLAPDETGLPLELWRGVDMAAAEALMTPLALPPRSPAIHALWRRMLLSEATAPAGTPSPAHFRAVRLEGLYRSGLTADMAGVVDKAGPDATQPLIAALAIRRHLVSGDIAAACTAVKPLAVKSDAGTPKLLRGEAHLISGLCAVTEGNSAAAGIAAEIAREEGIDAPLALQILDGLAIGARPKAELPARLTVLDYRFLELLGPSDPAEILEKAEPALLVALATAPKGEIATRLAAAERAASLNALEPPMLGAIYLDAARAGEAAGGPGDAGLRRAALYRAFTDEQATPRGAQLARQLLDDARKSAMTLPMLRLLATTLLPIKPGPDMGGLAEIAVEALLANGNHDAARAWVDAFPALGLWRLLIDIDDARMLAPSRDALAFAEEQVRRNRLPPELLHRLATVLDALDTDVPLTIWDAAGRTPQPARGHLPDAGTLPLLAEAAKKGETARTILLTMKSLGPSGSDGAHLIALGDTIRALRKVGLTADARHVALEALFAAWPRGAPA